MAKKMETKIAKADEKKSLAKVDAVRGELIDVSDWSLVSDPDCLEAVTYNLKGETLSEFDLDRIRVPAAGGIFFEVPVLGQAEPESEKTIRGILLSVSPRKAYWKNPEVSGSPPDCSSSDGINGSGTIWTTQKNPSGVRSCEGCPFNQFGSAVKQDGSQGRGKRCRESRVMLMLRESDRLPVAIVAPSASIKNVRKYLLSLPVHMFSAVTEVSLEKDKSTDGTPYSKINLRYVGHIGSELAKEVRKYADAVKNAITAQRPMGADLSVYREADEVDPKKENESSLAGFMDDGEDDGNTPGET